MNFTCEHFGFYYEDTLAMKANILSCVVLNFAKTLPTILLNLFIIAITCRKRSDNITTKTLLTNLVIVDLIMGTFTSPFAAAEFMLIYLHKDPCFLTTISAPLSFIFGAVSFVTLAALAIDSFVLFCHPFRHAKMQNKPTVICMLITVWLLPLYPTINAAANEDMRQLDQFVLVTGTLIIIINTFCYGMIYRLIRHHQRQIHGTEARFGINNHAHKNKGLVSCGIMLLIATIFCYFPMVMLSTFSLATNRSNKRLIGYFTYWAWTLAALNSLLNPILKFYRLTSIRRAFKEFWRRRNFRNCQNTKRIQVEESSPF